jgi:hypothetical protein
MYAPLAPPQGEEDFRKWIYEELRRLEATFSSLDFIILKETHVEPSRPRSGMVVLADGTDWDPGSGQGFYGYYNGGWEPLG